MKLLSFFKPRLVAIVIGFFTLFLLIGFAKWCFAQGYYQITNISVGNGCVIAGTNPYGNRTQAEIDQDIKSYIYRCGENHRGYIYFDNCTASALSSPSDSPGLGCIQGSQNYNYDITYYSDVPGELPVTTHTSLGYRIWCVAPGMQSITTGSCDCTKKEAAWTEANCSGEGQTLVSYDCANDTGVCDDCVTKQNNWVTANCAEPGAELLSYDCPTDTGDCLTCSTKQAAWVAVYCSSPDQTLVSYNCPTDTGVCDDCITKQNNWVTANCAEPGAELLSYDCPTDTGDCLTCSAKQAAWVAVYCSSPDQSLVSYDCPSDTGVCDDCITKQNNWVATNCSEPGAVLLSYDCPTDTGDCLTCSAKQADWVAANCSGPGQSLLSFDCPTNTGVCDDCITKQNNWVAANCSEPGAELISYDCTSDTGNCMVCNEKQATWVAVYCSGPGQSLASYTCPTNTGVCDDCIAKQNAWVTASCFEPGAQLSSYDCPSNTGDCYTCAEKKAAWIASNCLSGQADSYNCLNDTGICKQLCDLKINKFSGNTTTLKRTTGDKIRFTKSTTGTYDTAAISVNGVKILENSWVWNGKLGGKLITPGTYNATLTISKNSIPNCSASSSTTIKVDEDPNSCNLKVSFGSSANIANGNLSHSQEVFSLPGSGLSTDLSLYYNSTDPYNGPLGMGWSHSYNITLTEQASGDVLVRTGNGGYKLYQYANGIYLAPRGDYSLLSRNPDNTFALTRPDGQTYRFNDDGLIATITDRNGNAMQFAYDNSLLATISDSAERVTTFAYDANAKLSAITAPDGQVYRFAVVGDRLELVGAAYPGARFWDYTYDANGFLLSKMDPNGNLTTYTYDDQYRVLTATDPEGRVRTINYPTGAGQILTSELVEKDGGVWRYTYDTGNGDLLTKVDPQGNSTSYTYDAAGNQLSETGPDGGVTSHTYDVAGNQLSTTDPAGQTTAYTYNESGQTTSVSDTAGGVTSYSYDEQGNLLNITDPAGATTVYIYDTAGRVTSVTDAAGGVTSMAYDAAGNLIAITDPAGAKTSMEYDAAGRLLTQTDPQGGVTTFTYDAAGNLVSTTDPLGGVTSAGFDANGNRTSQIDANGNATFYDFNAQGQVVKSTDALGQVTIFSYGGGSGCATCSGGVNKLTALTDANGHATTFDYDSLGRLVKEVDPLGNVTAYLYDAKGNLTAKTDANGATIRYSYDTLGRLLKRLYPDNSEEIFSYDARGNILTAANTAESYLYAYDTNGRLASVTNRLGRKIAYAYDTAGRKVKMTGPDGKVIGYEYDPAGRLGKIRSGGDFVFGYDQSGRRNSLTYPNGVVAAYSYDDGGRLTSLVHKNSARQVVAKSAYSHDAVGNRLSKATTGEELRYGYDSIYRLLSARPGGDDEHDEDDDDGDDDEDDDGRGEGEGYGNSERYKYDPVGNRLSGPASHEHQPGSVYDATNRLREDQRYRYQYDRNGNLIAKAGKDGDDDDERWSYRYDFENRLVEVVKHGDDEAATVTFAYDPMGRRVEKRVTEREDGKPQTRVTRYLYDNEDILLETDATGKITNRYLHGPGIDEPLVLVQGKSTYYYHADGLGSIVALTDAKGKGAQEYQYDSFGNLHDQMNRVKQPYTYTGREWDKESELYFYRARYYDAKVGRFISKDPIGFEGGINQFSYVAENPINNTDPTGQSVYLCTRPLKGVPHVVYDYLGIGHRYLWVDGIGGWGLAPKQKYENLAVITPVPGWIEPEGAMISCTLVTDDSCMEKKIKEKIQKEKSTWHIYSLKFHNCYNWANYVLGASL